jgi:hypothetical protein
MTDTIEVEQDYSYAKTNPDHIEGSKPTSKSFADGKINYNEIFLGYNYGTPEHPIRDSFYMEGPVLSSLGIVTKEEEKNGSNGTYTKVSHSMMFTFDLKDQECVTCVQKWKEVHKSTSHVLGKYGVEIGFSPDEYDPNRPGKVFKEPIYFKREGGKIIEGRNPSMWVKLNHYRNNKTLFTDLEGNPIDWSLLRDVDVKLVPLWHIEKIYIGGGKASLQIKLASAVVIDIVPINSVSRQMGSSTVQRLKQKYGNLASKVESQIAQLRMDRQDQLEMKGGHKDGLVGSMHNIPSGQSDPGESDDQALKDFLGGAPTMNQTTQPASSFTTHSTTQQVQHSVQSQPPVQQSHPGQTYQQQQPVKLNVQHHIQSQPQGQGGVSFPANSAGVLQIQ